METRTPGWPRSRLVTALILITFCGILLLILAPVFLSPAPRAPGVRCLSNLRLQGAALLAYADENCGHLPVAANWCSAVRRTKVISNPQVPILRVLTCPALPNGQLGGYAFNSALSAAKPPVGRTAARSVSIFECAAGLNHYGGQRLLLKQPRHYDGVNLAFADGHVKWMKEALTGKLTWDLPQTEERR